MQDQYRAMDEQVQPVIPL